MLMPLAGGLQMNYRIPLVVTNEVLVFGSFLALLCLLLRQRRKHAFDRFTREAFQGGLVPLTVGVGLWSVDTALLLWWLNPNHVVRRSPTDCAFRGSDYVLNSLVSLALFYAGWSLLRLERRIHPRLRPERRSHPVAHALQRVLGHNHTLLLMCVLVVVFLAGSLWQLYEYGPAGQGMFDLADFIQAFTACFGLCMLGVGLLRELTRE